MPAIDGGQIRGELFLDGKKFSAGLDQAGKKASNFEKFSKRSSKNVARGFDGISTSIGRTIIQYAGLAAAATAAFKSIKKSANLGAEFANIATLGDFSAESIERVRQETLKLSLEIRKSPIDLAKAYYQAVSSGAEHGAEALDLLRQSAILANAGLSSTKVAVDAVTNVMNSYGKEVISATRTTDILIQVVRDGKTTLEEFAPTIGKVANDAASLGIRFEEVAAAAAQLTRTMPTEIAMTALAGAFKGLTAASKDFKKEGINIFKEIKTRGLVGALELLDKVTGGNQEKMRELIGDMRGVRGILGLTGAGAKDFARILDNMENSAGAARVAFDKQAKSIKAMGQVIGVTSDVMLTKLGDIVTMNAVVQRAFGDLANSYRDSVDNMSTNSSALNENIGNAFIGIIRGGAGVIKMFKGISLAMSTVSLISANIAAGIQKPFLALDIRKTVNDILDLKEQFKSGAVTQRQYAIAMAGHRKMLEELTGAQVDLDDTVVKYFNVIEQGALDIAILDLNTENYVKTLKESIKLANEFVGPLQPAPSPGVQDALRGIGGDGANSARVKFTKDQLAAMEAETDRYFAVIASKEDRSFDLEVARLQNLESARQADFDIRAEQFDIRLQNEQDAEDRAFEREISALQHAQAQREAWLGSWETSLQSFQGLSANVFSQVRDGFADTMADMVVEGKNSTASMADFFKSLQKTVISGLIKIGIQQVAQFVLSKTLSGARIAASGIEAAAVAAQWAPPAALTSLASFGANAVPAQAGIASTVALAQTLAIPSREFGGPVSAGLVNVHNDEFVLSKMQTEDLSSLLSTLSEKLENLGNAGGKIVIEAKGSMMRELIGHMNVEIEDNGVRSAATVLV